MLREKILTALRALDAAVTALDSDPNNRDAPQVVAAREHINRARVKLGNFVKPKKPYIAPQRPAQPDPRLRQVGKRPKQRRR